LLSDADLTAALDSGELEIDPLHAGQVQPASIDLRLADEFLELPEPDPLFPSYIDPLDPPSEEYRRRSVGAGDRYPLMPGTFALACTVETIRLGSSLAGVVAGKSSLARLGLVVESAGFVDPGFAGQITCELANLTDRPIMLSPGMRICQLVIHRLDSPCRHPYGCRRAGSHYQGQRGPTPSRMHQKVA
jgi:dCTP deaminase